MLGMEPRKPVLILKDEPESHAACRERERRLVEALDGHVVTLHDNCPECAVVEAALAEHAARGGEESSGE